MTPVDTTVETPAEATSAQTVKLADFLCFALYSAHLAMGKAYKPVLEDLGLTYTQWIILVALSEEDNQTVGGLGEKLFLESNTLTPILKKLEELGYLRRRRDPADERQVLVSLTETGRRLRERGGAHRGTIVEATGLTLDEFRALQREVARLRDNLIENTKAKG